ncbi:MAG: DUF4038 domain-containing protein [Acidobacteriota bacterium]
MPRSFASILLAGLCFLLTPAARGQIPDDVDPWRRWETVITSSTDFTQGGGNPYRDLVLQIEFRQRHGTQAFVQDAFWTGPSSPRDFKVRTMLPPGTWDWMVVGCTGTTGGQSCASGVSWTPASGTIQVDPDPTPPSTTVRLYQRGALKQLGVIGPGSQRFTDLWYDDGTNFFWAGDTAWTAPARTIDAGLPSGLWSSYLATRRQQSFTTILIAPSVAWQPQSPQTWPALPTAVSFSFDQIPGCAGQPIPNACSTPVEGYWRDFDAMIQEANDQDLLVTIVGLIDPVGLGANGTYPEMAHARAFARYLAARLAGNHVVFSPGFDTKVGDLVFNSPSGSSAITAGDSMDAVGQELRRATPRHLVTNHLAGRSPCEDYLAFESSSWMTFYLFQSGHAKGNGPLGGLCPGRSAGESAYRGAIRRARTMPLVLAAESDPEMPVINGEGPYDGLESSHSSPPNILPDTRYGVRQAAHLSLLSGATGFTYGVDRIWAWHDPGAYFQLPSANDMKRLFERFTSFASNGEFIPLQPNHQWIVGQGSGTPDELRKVLATYGSDLVVAYLPSDPASSEITISNQGISDLSCDSGTWTITWLDPRSNALNIPVHCSSTQGGTAVTLTKPGTAFCNLANANCDWLLTIERNDPGSGGGGQQGSPLEARDDHWTAVGGLVARPGENLRLPTSILDNDQPPGGVWTLGIEPTGSTAGTVQACGTGTSGVSLCYTPPAAGFSGEDTFRYTIGPDGEISPTASALITVLVEATRPPIAGDDEISIPAGATSWVIPDSLLLTNDSDPDGQPLAVCGQSYEYGFGTLVREADSFVYTPGSLFPIAGSDAFQYTICDESDMTAEAWVRLSTPASQPVVFEDALESGDLGSWTSTYVPQGGSVEANAEGALNGAFGLSVESEPGTTFAFAQSSAPEAEDHLHLFLQLDAVGLDMAEGDSFIVASALGRNGNVFDLRISRHPGGFRLRTFAFGETTSSTPWHFIPDGPVPLRLEWWAASHPDAEDGGLRLWLGHQPIGLMLDLDNAGKVVDTLRAGIAGGLDSGTSGRFALDTFRLWRGSCSRTPVFFDDLESQSLNAWSSTQVSNGGQLLVSAQAALEGDAGLAVEAVAGSTFVFAASSAPSGENPLEVFFRIDPNSLAMNTGSTHGVAAAMTATGATAFDVRLGRSASGYRLRAMARDDNGGVFLTPWTAIADAAVTVRIEHQTGSTPGSSDGSLRWWIDGVAAGVIPDLDNSQRSVETFRVGVVSGLDPRSVGTTHFDDVRIWSPSCP